ncbi:MAG: hypothetical protein E2O54_13915 [Gammaproteobacteria bacterium]|nr:MAG: hypothetical protein E2O54_13915 [Gammaproteobacteria bacterium]
MPEFHSENKIPGLRSLSRVGPIIVIAALTYGLGTLRISDDVLIWAVSIFLGLAIVAYFLVRALMERRALHIKIGTDWIRIRRGTRVLSAPLHYVSIEKSMLFDNRFKVSHPRKKLSFTISVDRFPKDQRAGLSALLDARAKPGGGALASFINIDPPSPR